MPIFLENGVYLKDENGDVYHKPMPNADSGILLKGVGQANFWCWPAGSGVLWSVRNNKDLPANVRAGAVPQENADQPVGEWNAMDITVQGDRITVVNNGIEVISHALYPGLDVKGPIGLQHHGGEDPKTGKLRPASSLVQFRNIWIKEL
ncbi:MAG: 3-keto-disaccharide hydrolase [Candidatus Cyclobacteriaceae bacterium M3_2C_046]